MVQYVEQARGGKLEASEERKLRARDSRLALASCLKEKITSVLQANRRVRFTTSWIEEKLEIVVKSRLQISNISIYKTAYQFVKSKAKPSLNISYGGVHIPLSVQLGYIWQKRN